jgi:hypothetical protein
LLVGRVYGPPSATEGEGAGEGLGEKNLSTPDSFFAFLSVCTPSGPLMHGE